MSFSGTVAAGETTLSSPSIARRDLCAEAPLADDAARGGAQALSPRRGAEERAVLRAMGVVIVPSPAKASAAAAPAKPIAMSDMRLPIAARKRATKAATKAMPKPRKGAVSKRRASTFQVFNEGIVQAKSSAKGADVLGARNPNVQGGGGARASKAKTKAKVWRARRASTDSPAPKSGGAGTRRRRPLISTR